MRGLEILSLGCVVVSGVFAIPKPFTPYEAPKFGSIAGDDEASGAKLMLKRTTGSAEVHLEIARVQAVNRAYKKFAKRLRCLRVIS